MQEIVALMINGTIISDPHIIMKFAEYDNIKSVEYISRDKMKFMADADLGQHWRDWANAPTLFGIDENYKQHFLKNGIFKSKN